MNNNSTDKLDKLRQMIATVTFGQAKKQYENDSAFRDEVDRLTADFARRYAAKLSRDQFGAMPAKPSQALNEGLRALGVVTEEIARYLAAKSTLTIGDLFKSAEQAPIAALRLTPARFQLPLGRHFQSLCEFPEEAVEKWRRATLSVQHRRDGVRFVLSDQPPGCALAIAVAGEAIFVLDADTAAKSVHLSKSDEFIGLRVGLMPFERPRP